MSSDPLASVITQVQPGQGAPHARGPGPARPTKVAKQGTAKAAAQQQAAAAAGGSGERKKKKKKKVKRRTDDEEAAGAQQQDPQTSTSATKPSSTEQQHSAQASSTLAGTVTSIPDAQVAATPGAVGVGETDAAAKMQSAPTHDQDLTKAAQALQSTTDDEPQKRSTATPSGHKGDLTSSTVKGSSRTPSVPPKTAGSPAASPPPTSSQGKKKKSSLSKLFAILTCSSGAAGMADDEKSSDSRANGENIEMRSGLSKSNRDGAAGTAKGKSQTNGAGLAPSSGAAASKAGKAGGRGRNRNDAGAATSTSSKDARLAPPIKTRAGRSGSRSSSTRNSLDRRSETGIVAPAPGTPTAGGGTMLPREETGDVMSGAVVPPGSSFVTPDSKRGSAAGTPSKRAGARGEADGDSDEQDETTSEEEVTDDETDEEDGSDGLDPDYIDDEELNEEQRLIAQGGIGIPRDEFGNEHPLLPALGGIDTGRKCLVLDLDETLVHSSFKMITNADFIVPVEIEGTIHNVYVIKRPGVDEFMRRMGEIYEVVVFTASLSKYADPVLDILDIHRVVRHRLFRESCYNHRGNYVKDLSQLGRPISESIIIDNSPASYIFHPNNAVPISSWFNDPHDTELTDLCPFLADLCEVGDVRAVLDGGL